MLSEKKMLAARRQMVFSSSNYVFIVMELQNFVLL